jgi:hypothetical protein
MARSSTAFHRNANNSSGKTRLLFFSELILDLGKLAPEIAFHRDRNLVLLDLYGLLLRIAVKFDLQFTVYVIQLFEDLISPAFKVFAVRVLCCHMDRS